MRIAKNRVSADIARNRTRNDNAARPRKARAEAEEKEEINILGKYTAECRTDEYEHPDEERNPPPMEIAQRPCENLSECHAERRHGQRHLNE